MKGRAGLVGVVLVAVTGCTSSAVSGSTTPGTARATVSRAPAPAVAPPPRTVPELCPAARTDTLLATCLVTSLNTFWSKTLRRPVEAHVRIGFPATFPKGCSFPKESLDAHLRAAFECPDNRTLYFGPVLLRNLHEDEPANAFGERLAAVTGHEEGHLVQDTVHLQGPTDADFYAGSRLLEQQADCLSGAWARGIGLDTKAFLASARVMLTDVDDADHRLTHGTVDQRVAAVRRGFTGVAACHLPKG